MASKRDLENIDVSAAMFDANDPDVLLESPGITIPDEVLKFYQPENMVVEGPHMDGSILVGLRLVPRR